VLKEVLIILSTERGFTHYLSIKQNVSESIKSIVRNVPLYLPNWFM